MFRDLFESCRLRCGAGFRRFILCLIYAIIQRETLPYLEAEANLLSVWAAYVIATICFSVMMIAAARPGYFGWRLGWFLTIITFSVMALSVLLHFGLLRVHERRWAATRRRSSYLKQAPVRPAPAEGMRFTVEEMKEENESVVAVELTVEPAIE